jgi:hypothetical protein
MIRLAGGQVEWLLDLGSPLEVRELPVDLAALDELLDDRAVTAGRRSRSSGICG